MCLNNNRLTFNYWNWTDKLSNFTRTESNIFFILTKIDSSCPVFHSLFPRYTSIMGIILPFNIISILSINHTLKYYESYFKTSEVKCLRYVSKILLAYVAIFTEVIFPIAFSMSNWRLILNKIYLNVCHLSQNTLRILIKAWSIFDIFHLSVFISYF